MVRGLKTQRHGSAIYRRVSRTHAGAWIETTWSKYVGEDGVAPHAGAWIETPQDMR